MLRRHRAAAGARGRADGDVAVPEPGQSAHDARHRVLHHVVDVCPPRQRPPDNVVDQRQGPADQVVHRLAPFGYFHTACAQKTQPNLIRLRISPDAGVTFDLLAQHEGDAETVDRISAKVDFTHLTGSGTAAYELVLTDAVSGDPRRFTRMDMVEESWRIIGDLLDPEDSPTIYRQRSWGPVEAVDLAEDGWR